ncbi:LuxR C-terminal-related transcriptional regulator [Nocardia sp. NPDC004722]
MTDTHPSFSGENDDDARQPARVPRLSDREREVLRAWIHCDSKDVVSKRLGIALSTVNTHLLRIREKYDAVGRPAHTKAGLVARALQDGWIALAEL